MIYYIALSTLILSFLASLLSFRLDYPLHLKVFSLLLGCMVVDELGALYLVKTFHISNLGWYNVFMGIEAWAYALYYSLILQNRRVKLIIRRFLFLFPIFWFIVVFKVFGIANWNSYLAVTGSLFTICLSIAYYYQLFTASDLIKLTESSEFWIATGLILCYSCSLPYTGMMNFLNKNFPVLSSQLLTMLQILNILMYSLFTYAFICKTLIKRSS